METKKSKIKEDKVKLNKNDLITSSNLQECVRDVFLTAIRRLNAAEERLDRAVRSLKTKSLEFRKLKAIADDKLGQYIAKMESIEDTFFTLYHNIKKNQFLYADAPEEWWNDYLDLKRHYKEENKKGDKDVKTL